MVAAIILFPPSPHTFKLFDVLERSNKHFPLVYVVFRRIFVFGLENLWGYKDWEKKFDCLFIHEVEHLKSLMRLQFMTRKLAFASLILMLVWLYSVFSTIFHDGLPWTKYTAAFDYSCRLTFLCSASAGAICLNAGSLFTVCLYLEGQITEISYDFQPPPKLFNRSADLKKVFFFAGSVWTPEKTQGEVGGDQEPPGDTWRHPTAPKKIFSIKIFLA